nr:uncharacterized protein LOC108127866 [Drosophila bipectinata]
MVHLSNGLLLLLSIVKHQSEFDTKVKLPELENAIGKIEIAVGVYHDKAKSKLDRARGLNRAAIVNYQQSIRPVFEWCDLTIGKFNHVLPHIKEKNMTTDDKDYIWGVTVNTLHDGLNKTLQSLDLLNDVQNKSYEITNLLADLLHDLHNEFGPQGLFGSVNHVLDTTIKNVRKNLHIPFYDLAGEIAGNIEIQKKELHEQFLCIKGKIEYASQIAKTGVNPYLEEDKTNLLVLRGKTKDADFSNPLLTFDSPTMRALYIPILQDLISQCRNYNLWHKLQT